ncbi:hypothetical protein B0H14DRAFT_2623682 [Mycena olivaceomarginata]|nr:hypothetical protein B0H14DRAFT_2623682 [Mycena olivaceomarginata]
MHSPSSSKSPSTSPARLSPFSLAEFRALISAALDFDPCPAPRALPPHIDEPPRPAAQKKSAQNLHHFSAPTAANSSRMRLMLSKLKKRAAAAVLPSEFQFYVQERRHCAQRRLGAVQTVPPPRGAIRLDTGVYEDADPFAKGAVRVMHRSCEALPSTYSYHSANNNYSGYAASPRVHRTGRGRRIPIAPLIRARARELDVELRELSGKGESGEAEGDEVDEFVLTQFAIGKDEEQEEQEIDDSGIFLDENFTFVPARSSTPPRPSPSAAASKLTRAPTARTYPIAARARARVRPGSPFPLSRSLSAFASASAAPAVPGDYVR